MCKLLGKRRKILRAFLSGVIFFSAVPAAECHAQLACPTQPVITSVQPSKWPVGQTFVVQITGTNLFNDPTEGGVICNLGIPQIVESTGQVSFPDFAEFGMGDRTDSFIVWDPTEIDLVATVPSTVPAENACLFVASATMFAGEGSRVTGLPILDPPPGLANGTGVPCTGNSWVAAFPVKIVAGGPTITSIQPSSWFASQNDNITITGTGFLTASDSGGPTQLAVTVASGSIALSNVSVISATQITATMNLSKDATTETATVTATNSGGGSGSGTAQVYALPAITDTSDLQNAVLSVSLSAPSGTTGDLVPDFHGTDASGTAIDSGPDIPSLAPGQQDVDLDFDSIGPAVYTRADGNWYPLAPSASSPVTLNITPYTFPIPWTYFRKVFYTQYNVPHESACAGGDSDAWIVSTSTVKGKTVCSFQKMKLNSQFIAATWLNGTGVDGDGDILKNAVAVNLGSSRGEVCYGQYPEGAVGHGNGNTFEIVSSITGSCSRTLVPDQSVAIPCAQAGSRCLPSVLSGVQALSCGSQLNLDSGDHTTAYTRTAADLCPACSNTSAFFDESSPMNGADGHIDAFSSNVSCTGKGVGSLGFFYTSYPTN